MEERPPQLPANTKQAAVAIRTNGGRAKYAWRYRDAVIVAIHIKRSGGLITSVEVFDDQIPSKIYKGWSVKPNSDIDTAHHLAINFMTGCYDQAGNKYLYVIKCIKV